jgi:hypothetical protein
VGCLVNLQRKSAEEWGREEKGTKKMKCAFGDLLNFVSLYYFLVLKIVLKIVEIYKIYLTTFYFTIVYYILGYNQLSNSCSMATDEPAHVRACSTASTPACTVPDLLSRFENTKKYRQGDARQNPTEIPDANTPSAVRG